MNITSSTSPTLEGISRCRHLAVHSKGAKTNQNVKSIKLILKKLSLYIILLQLFQRKHTTYLLYSLQSCNTLLNLYMTFPEIFQFPTLYYLQIFIKRQSVSRSNSHSLKKSKTEMDGWMDGIFNHWLIHYTKIFTN